MTIKLCALILTLIVTCNIAQAADMAMPRNIEADINNFESVCGADVKLFTAAYTKLSNDLSYHIHHSSPAQVEHILSPGNDTIEGQWLRMVFAQRLAVNMDNDDDCWLDMYHANNSIMTNKLSEARKHMRNWNICIRSSYRIELPSVAPEIIACYEKVLNIKLK